MQRLKYRLPNNNTLCWRHNDFGVFLFSFVCFFGIGIVVIFNFNTEWWLLPVGIGEVFLFLFIICKKVDNNDR